MITSTANRQVKNLIQLQKKSKVRRQQGLYVVEGVRMFKEAPEQFVRQIYVSEAFLSEPRHQAMLVGKTYETLSDAVFAHVSDTQTPQGILCVMQMPEYSLDGLLRRSHNRTLQFEEFKIAGKPCGMIDEAERIARENGFLSGKRKDAVELTKDAGIWLVLENIQDPGNLGTMFRTAEGAGIAGIIMDRNTVDIFNPKTIRSTMGSIFRVPFVVADSLAEAVAQLKAHGVRVYAAHLDGSVCYDEPDYTEAGAFLVGNEGNGLTDEAAALADTFLRIPMGGKLESLNAAMAAGILMYEANRQRRQGGIL